jgi:ATP-binding cassette subfamily B protein
VEKPFGLHGVTFSLKRGEKLAVVGKIGSGKTTLLNCVAGILQPDSGDILINDVPVHTVPAAQWRSQIGFIQQEPVVFSETVAVNLDFWRGCSREHIESCARISQLDTEIRAFPHQYDEKVGQRGVTLSGGQRQRLSVARALVGNPQLVLMDDITSSLDAENEQKLWKDLGEFAEGITCVIVTHRLASAQYADRIMVLDHGTIEAVDTHRNLLLSSPTYQELVNQ